VGRLFRKFFILIWCVQLVGIVVTGAIFWLERQREDAERAAVAAQTSSLSAPAESQRPPHGHGPRLPVVPIVVTLFASLLTALLLAWYFAKPIRALRGAFESAAGGDLEVRIGHRMARRRDELAELGRDFDHMAERLQALVEGQRRLLHDVSHELRSPLARLQAAIGLARQQPGREELSLSRIEREAERMDALVGELLTLSRLEAGVAGGVEAVEIAELLDGLLEDARFEAAAAGKQIRSSGAPEVRVQANGELLHRAVENVMRNAIRHTPAGGEVEIQADVAGEVLRLRVADRGPGVAEAELDAIFRPFFRGGSAPSGEGHGLGLAIALRVVEGLGGTIEVANRDGGGLEVTLRLPVVAGDSRL